MPPKKKITKEMIIDKAFELVKVEGKENLNARELSKRLGCSTQPIFTCFNSMEEVQGEVKKKALDLYHAYREEGAKSDKPYKGTGLAYIKFAKENKNLFKLLFMDNINAPATDVNIEEKKDVEYMNSLIKSTLDTKDMEAGFIQLEGWIFVHGIASLIATDTVEFSDELIDMLFTKYFKGLKNQLKEN